MVLSGNKKMSTRAGTLIELEEVFERATNKAKEILESSDENNFKKPDVAEVIETIGVGAVLYHDLRQLRTQTYRLIGIRLLALKLEVLRICNIHMFESNRFWQRRESELSKALPAIIVLSIQKNFYYQRKFWILFLLSSLHKKTTLRM
jgi:hypothetical protein